MGGFCCTEKYTITVCPLWKNGKNKANFAKTKQKECEAGKERKDDEQTNQTGIIARAISECKLKEKNKRSNYQTHNIGSINEQLIEDMQHYKRKITIKTIGKRNSIRENSKEFPIFLEEDDSTPSSKKHSEFKDFPKLDPNSNMLNVTNLKTFARSQTSKSITNLLSKLRT